MMTKTERKAIENYMEHNWNMRNHYKERYDKTGDEWAREAFERYRDKWLSISSLLEILDSKEDLKYWANTEV